MTVSVIIPVYNVKPYLERCVRSVLNQTYKDFEIILVDDGSTDGSRDLCDHFASSDQRIQVIHQENQGLSGARNTGIRQAKGEYIIFMDSDDEWLLNDGLGTLIQHSDNDTDLVTFKTVDIWSQNRRTYPQDYDVEAISQLPDAQAVFSYLVKTQQLQIGACIIMVRRRILIENNIFFPAKLISEDVYWSMQLWQHLRMVIILNLPFYGYYHRTASLSTSPSIRVDRSYDKIFTDWKEKCHKGCVNSEAILAYMANLWVSRGYKYHQLQSTDKPEALAILKRHTDLLNHAVTPKAKRTAKMVSVLGVKLTFNLLGIYWRLRTRYKGHVV